jgi:hypothetical protein
LVLPHIVTRLTIQVHRLERIRKEAVVAKFKILSQHLPEGTEENYENPRPRFGPWTFRTQSRSANCSAGMIGDFVEIIVKTVMFRAVSLFAQHPRSTRQFLWGNFRAVGVSVLRVEKTRPDV